MKFFGSTKILRAPITATPPSVTEWVTATLEFWHKKWHLRLQTLQTFDLSDRNTERQKDRRQKKDKKGEKTKRPKKTKQKKLEDQKGSLILWCQGSFALLRCFSKGIWSQTFWISIIWEYYLQIQNLVTVRVQCSPQLCRQLTFAWRRRWLAWSWSRWRGWSCCWGRGWTGPLAPPPPLPPPPQVHFLPPEYVVINHNKIYSF